jgi:hypothetical protein
MLHKEIYLFFQKASNFVENYGVMDKTQVRKGKIEDQGNDFEYWQTKSFYERLLTLEQIREEYNRWKYGTEQGLQRVYTIVKCPQSPISGRRRVRRSAARASALHEVS